MKKAFVRNKKIAERAKYWGPKTQSTHFLYRKMQFEL
jgi:hypothetical protein